MTPKRSSLREAFDRTKTASNTVTLPLGLLLSTLMIFIWLTALDNLQILADQNESHL